MHIAFRSFFSFLLRIDLLMTPRSGHMYLTRLNLNNELILSLTAMEDSHTTRLKLLDDVKDKDADAFFAVFDGHGGAYLSGSQLNCDLIWLLIRIGCCQIRWG
jgi:hypothetical protein